MTPQKAVQSAKKVEETISDLQFIKPIRDTEIPARSTNRKSAINALPVWSELVKVAERTAASGVAPFEAAAEINVGSFKELLPKMKNPVGSFLLKVRYLLKQYKVANKIDVVRRGEKIFLVGM